MEHVHEEAVDDVLRRRPELRRLSKSALARELISKLPDDPDRPFRNR